MSVSPNPSRIATAAITTSLPIPSAASEGMLLYDTVANRLLLSRGAAATNWHDVFNDGPVRLRSTSVTLDVDDAASEIVQGLLYVTNATASDVVITLPVPAAAQYGRKFTVVASSVTSTGDITVVTTSGSDLMEDIAVKDTVTLDATGEYVTFICLYTATSAAGAKWVIVENTGESSVT